MRRLIPHGHLEEVPTHLTNLVVSLTSTTKEFCKSGYSFGIFMITLVENQILRIFKARLKTAKFSWGNKHFWGGSQEPEPGWRG